MMLAGVAIFGSLEYSLLLADALLQTSRFLGLILLCEDSNLDHIV